MFCFPELDHNFQGKKKKKSISVLCIDAMLIKSFVGFKKKKKGK